MAGGLRQNVVRDGRVAPICAGVTGEVEEEWTSVPLRPLAGDRRTLLH